MKKNPKTIIPILMLSMLAMSAFAIALTSVVSANTLNSQPYFKETTDLVYVTVSPEGVGGVEVGQTFTVSVALSGLEGKNLYGFDIRFWWNPNAVEYVGHEVKISSDLSVQSILNQPVYEVLNTADASAGSVSFAYASLLPAEPSNDDGTVFTVTFTLLAPSEKPFWVQEVVLADNKGNIIPVVGFQDFEGPSPPPAAYSVSDTLSRHRMLSAAKWLEWWITVTWMNH